MNKKLHLVFLSLVSLLFAKMNAQTYQSLSVSSGYNSDLIANGSGAVSTSTTESVDAATGGYAFMSTDFVNGSGVAPLSGLPANGLINSVATSGLPFQLASYSGNNALRLANTNDAGSVSFSANPKASKLYMLATSGGGSCVAEVVVTFADNTTQTFSGTSVSDWYGGSSYAIQGIGRVNRANDDIENNSVDPRLYEIGLVIPYTSQTKDISSVSVKKTSGTGILCVFGFSYKIPSSCAEPVNLSASNVASNSATVSWDAVPGVSSYELYQSTSNVAPAAASTPTVTGITGATTNLTGLTPSTQYYVWVRSNCSGSTGDWSSASASFTTLCAPVNVPYLEDFNASASFPPCTSWQKVNQGTWYFFSNFGGFTSRTLSGAASGSATDLWFYTKALNLEAGKTYKLSFDYSTWLGAQSFKVAYGTSAVNTSMTNLIQDYPGVTKDNTPTSVNLTITPTVSGVYYIGFNQYTNGFSYLFIDNISVTEDVTLAVSENQLSDNGVKLYPNPTSDYLYLKTDRKIANVKIHDASGKLVKSQDKPDQKIDVSQLASGTYMMVVKGADGTSSTHNFIKK